MSYYNGKKVLSVASVEYLTPRGQIKLTENGSYDVQAYKKAVVAVFPSGTIQTIEDEGVAQGAGAFPSTILPKGLVNYVGGMSQKVNQLQQTQAVITAGTFSSVTISNENGYVNVNGTADGYINSTYFNDAGYSSKTIGGHKYLLFGCPAGGSSSTYMLEPLIGSGASWCYGYPKDIGSGCIFEAKDEQGNLGYIYGIRLRIVSGATLNNLKFNCYLADLTEIYGAGNEPTSTSDPRIIQLISLLKKYPEYNEGSIVNAKVTNLLSTDGTNETNYPIPAEVQALDGYGLGIDDTLYNYTDFERKKFVKKVGVVDLGSLSWTLSQGSDYWYYYAVLPSACKNKSSSAIPNIIFEKYSRNRMSAIGFINNEGSAVDMNVVVTTDDISNTPTGMLYYELDEPTETDISEYLDRDFPNENLIDLYADGKVYFENEKDMKIPYSLTYQERIN